MSKEVRPNNRYIKQIAIVIIVLQIIGLLFATYQLVSYEYPEIPEFTPRPKTVPDLIEYYAGMYDVDPELAKAIAWSESEYKNVWNSRHDERPDYYTAFGIFQIVRSTYEGFCGDPDERFIIEKNIKCAMIIITESGTHHWSESYSGWRSYQYLALGQSE